MAFVIGYVEMIVAVLCFVLLRHWRVHRNTNVIITNWPLVGMLPGLLRNVSCIHDFVSHVLKKGRGTVEIKGPSFANLDFLVDLQEVFQRLTFDNICLLVLGFDPNCLSIEFPKVTYEKAFDEIEKIILRRHVQPQSWLKLQKWLQIGGEKKLTKSLKVFDEFLHQCISAKRHEYSRIDKKDESNFDMLTIYIAEEQKQLGQTDYLSTNFNKFLRDTAFNFLVAGRDTIGAALTWFFWLVSTHPFVETKLVEEIKEKLAPKHDDKDKVFDAKKVNKLVYLHAALCESLRLHPPIPINHKASSQSDILPSGQHIKQNQRILISFYSMGRMEEIWGQDCLEFKPERWISDKGEIVYVPSYKFTAFNNGPRTCLGKNMTFLQMKMVATVMLWNFRFQVVEGHPISPDMSIILYMKHGLKVKVSNRLCGA